MSTNMTLTFLTVFLALAFGFVMAREDVPMPILLFLGFFLVMLVLATTLRFKEVTGRPLKIGELSGGLHAVYGELTIGDQTILWLGSVDGTEPYSHGRLYLLRAQEEAHYFGRHIYKNKNGELVPYRLES